MIGLVLVLVVGLACGRFVWMTRNNAPERPAQKTLTSIVLDKHSMTWSALDDRQLERLLKQAS